MEQLVLVNEQDEPIGVMEKMEAHEKGLLHRAFSVIVFNSKGEMLLQKRASSKYHSGGLWTNACCSHPRPGETVIDAAKRRMLEENNFAIDNPKFCFSFIYKSPLDNELTEHELDHVLVAFSDELPQPNPEEADALEYWDLEKLKLALKKSPEIFTVWFKILMDRLDEIIQHIPKN